MKKTFKSLLVALLVLLAVAALTLVACDQTPDDAPHQHTFSSRWSSNDVEHWHAATCGHDETADLAAHDYGTDNVCDTCGYTKAPSGSDDPGSQGGGGSQGDDPAPNTVTVTFAINYSGGTNPSARTVAQGSSVILPGASRTGYAFDGWYTESSGGTLVGKEGASYVAKASVTLYAHWTVDQQGEGGSDDPGSQGGGGSQGDDPAPNIVTVTFSINYSGGTDPFARTVAQGSSIILPGASRTGYTFDGWYTESSGGTLVGKAGASYFAKASITLYAHWTANQQGGSGSQGGGSQGGNDTPSDTSQFYFEPCDGGYSIRADSVIDPNITIPSIYNGQPVVSIGGSAFENCSQLTSITIPSTVTSIGDWAFEGCSALQTVTFEGDSHLQSIGGSAFRDCSQLTSITIPSTVTSIGEYAFDSCGLQNVYYGGTIEDWCGIEFGDVSTNPMRYADHFYMKQGGDWQEVTKIEIPKGVEKIGDYQFYSFDNLTSITIPSTVTSIGNSAFFGCSALQTVTFEGDSHLQSIGGFAFRWCSQLKSITIPSTVTSIGEYAFWGCSALQTVTFEGNSHLQSIGDYAFYNCSQLTSITIPSTVTSIGDFAFHDCVNLRTITFEGDSQLQSIGDYTFCDCVNLRTITFEGDSQLQSIGDYTFGDCGGLTNVCYGGTIESWCGIEFGDVWSNPMVCAANFYMKQGGDWQEVTKIEIPKGVEQIGDYQFYSFDNLTSITIPSTVTSIGNSAFVVCRNLQSVTFEGDSQLKSIGGSAFNSCNNLKNVYYGGTIEDWCGIEFGNRLASPMVYATNFFMKQGGDWQEVTKIEIPKGVEKIGDYQFCDFGKVTSITIPSTVTSIGGSAFYNCWKLTSITISSTVTSIGNSAFGSCSALQAVTFEGNSQLQSIGDDAFSHCSSLTEITIPSTVTSIGNSAFRDCIQLVSIIIPNTITSIGYYAFSGSNKLTIYCEAASRPNTWELDWNSTNCPVEWNCCGSTSIDGVVYVLHNDNTATAADTINKWSVQVTIPQSVEFNEKQYVVSKIGNYAFYNYTRLTSIVIPGTVTSIGDYAFYGCSQLTIYCEAASQPNGWATSWNPDNRPVEWGYKKQ